jgi:hypothetical protein
MTVVDQNQRDQPRPPQSDQQAALTRADQARTDAHRVATLVQIAREGHGEARDHGEDAHRLREAIDTLYDRVASKPGDRRTRLDRALHGMDGALDETALLEYLDLVGREGMTARSALQRILDQRSWPEFDGGQEFSDRLHSLAHTWEQGARTHEAAAVTRPALPAAAPEKPAQLPRRVPGAAMQHGGRIAPQDPPMFPPAPPESPAEQTGQIFAALRENGHVIPEGMERAARKDHQTGPSFGPTPDPQFAPTALPVRLGDTVTMRADEVLAALAADDASQEMVADGPVKGGESSGPRPLVAAASTAASGSRPSKHDGGDSDDADA